MAVKVATVNLDGTSVGDIISETAATRIVVYGGTVHNGDSETVEIGLRAGDAGSDFWHAVLAKDGGGSIYDFRDQQGQGLELATNTPFVGILTNGTTYNVDVNVTYEEKTA